MSLLEEKLQSGQKVFTAEITPPKGAGIKKLVEHVKLVSPHVTAINITDCQRAMVKMSSLAACRVLLDQGAEPVYQLTCRDRNTIAIQSDLMGAGALQIPNVLCLTGDPVKAGDSPKSKSVFEIESLGQLGIVAALQSGRDLNGHKMNRKTQFFVGAVVNPTLKNTGQLTRLQKKKEAGARFFQTQANYDLDDYVNFLKEVQKTPVKILAGILVLHSAEMAHYIHREMPGVQIPDAVLKRFDNASDGLKEGIRFAVETMKAVAPYCDGFHLMTIRQEELIPVLKEAYERS